MQKQRSKPLKKVLPVSDTCRTMNFFLRSVLIVILFLSVFSDTKAQGGRFDKHILRYIEAHRTHKGTAFFKFVSKWNNPVCLAAPASLFITGLIKNDSYMKRSSLYVTESIAISSLVNVALKKIFKRKRPFASEVTFTAEVRPKNESFPSGHAAEAFSMATSMTLAYPKWYVIIPTYGWASLVGYSRVYLGVHYPTDVIGGAVIASGMSWLTYRLNHDYLKNK